MLNDNLKVLTIKMWGIDVAAVSWEKQGYAIFEYTDEVRRNALNLSPILMPLNPTDAIQHSINPVTTPYQFTDLASESFNGLPGLLADVLPGEFAASMFDELYSRQVRSQTQQNPLEKLFAIKARAMGALEFDSSIANLDGDDLNMAIPVDIEELTNTLKSLIQDRGQMQLSLSDEDDQASEKAFYNLIRVSTSAGGSQPKAVIAIHEKTGDMLSGQNTVPSGYGHWILKFDDLSDSQTTMSKQLTRIEYAYALMARAAKINISECRLLEQNGYAHFLTRRFDRVPERIPDRNKESASITKLHVQSLFALAHYDYTQQGKCSYEQAFEVMRLLRLPKSDALQLYRRMLFNIFACNQNDHTKNIAFTMDQSGKWKLAPAFNLTYSYNSDWGRNHHQMSVNGKCDNFTREDLLTVGEALSLPKVERVIDEVKQAVSEWSSFARRAGVKKKVISDITKMHRLDL